TCFLVGAQGKWRGYVGDQDIVHELLVNGWALAQHSGEQPAEVIARENKRGLWRGRVIDPDDWRAGKRLPGEPPPPAAPRGGAPGGGRARAAPSGRPAAGVGPGPRGGRGPDPRELG